MEEQPVGSHIMLVSNSEIRYEGLLHNIDPTSNTISLINVRIFGTEGRNNGINEVPPSSQLYDYIVFSGKDIKDITLYENSAPSADPAIVSATPARSGVGVTLPPTDASGGKPLTAVSRVGNVFGGPAGQQSAAGQPSQRPSSRREQPVGRDNNSNNNSNAGAAGRRWGGGGNYNRDNGGNNRDRDNHGRYHHQGGGGGGRGGYHRGGYGGAGGRGGGHYRRRFDIHTGQDFQPATGAQKEELKEFDFNKSQEELEKQRQEFEKAKEDAKVYAKAYNKNSFFDTISSDQKDKIHGPRMDREEMKRADAETFGQEMVGSMRGFRHSRGRGGRGRFARY